MTSYEEYYNFLGNFLQDIGHDQDSAAKRVPATPGFVNPGDVLKFWYPQYQGNPEGFRFTLVVNIKRGAGFFISSRNNKLLATFKLTTVSSETASSVLRLVYKNRRIADYYKLTEGLMAIFGKDAFRSYNTVKMSYVNQILIDKDKLNG